MTLDEKDNMMAEIDFIKNERERLQDDYSNARLNEKEARKEFDEEANNFENSKLAGQPVRAGIERVMKEMGVDRGEYHG